MSLRPRVALCGFGEPHESGTMPLDVEKKVTGFGSERSFTESRLQPLLPYAAYLTLVSFFCAPLFYDPKGLGIADWDYQFLQHAIVLRSLFEYRQLPFWNPWSCGGNVLWQNPQVALLSLVYPLTPVFSLPVAMKLNVMAHYLAGLVGMHLLLTRIFRLDFFPLVLFFASLFALAGAMTLHVAVGHAAFLFLPALGAVLLPAGRPNWQVPIRTVRGRIHRARRVQRRLLHSGHVCGWLCPVR